jgi:hypothetical protein
VSLQAEGYVRKTMWRLGAPCTDPVVDIFNGAGTLPSRQVSPLMLSPVREGSAHLPSWQSRSFRTCLIFNWGLSVLSTFQPRQRSHATTQRGLPWNPWWRLWGDEQLNTERYCLLGTLRSVGCWPLARNFNRFPGVNPTQYPLTCRRDWVRVSSS